MKFFKLSLLLVAILAVGHWGPKGWKAWFKRAPVETVWEVKEQKSFVIITPSYNNAKWCEKNLRSILDQDYDHYRVIYIDDASTDGTGEKVEKIVQESGQSHRFTILHNAQNQGAMANLHKALHMCQDDEIAVLVDGDDQLAHEGVLQKLNAIYANPDVWVTYGSYVEYPSYKRGGWAKPLPAAVLEKNQARTHKWGASHLKTFYAGLFKQIQSSDLMYEGQYLESASDAATMLPILEMAGTHAHFIKEILYIYNHVNPLNDDKLRWQKQADMLAHVRSLPAYHPLKTRPGESDFDEGMGRGTKHWAHVKQSQDLQSLNQFRTLFKDQGSHRFTKEGTWKIPPVVHFIWVGPRQFPSESVENIRTWMAQHPDWTFKFWTDRERPAPCHGMDVVVFEKYPFHLGKYYEASANWGEKSDVLRYEILFYEGGTYADHDANCLISFDGIHRGYDFYCGLEVPHPPVDGLNVTAGMGVLGARPGHPVIKRVIDLISGRWEELAAKYPGDDGFSKTQIVMERTYLPLTLALQGPLCENGHRDIVFPASYFFAKPGLQPVYSKHFFANAWAGDGKKQISFEKQITQDLGKIQNKFERMLLLVAIMAAFNLLLMGFSIKYMVRKT